MASRPKYCTECGDKRTERPGGICLDCERAANPPERRWKPCDVCGETTTSKKGTHPECRIAPPDPSSAIPLPPGDWRFDPFRRIQIYVPKPVAVDEVAAQRLTHQAPTEPAPMHECEYVGCSNSFVPPTKRRRYCCDRCVQAAYYLRKKARKAAA